VERGGGYGVCRGGGGAGDGMRERCGAGEVGGTVGDFGGEQGRVLQVAGVLEAELGAGGRGVGGEESVGCVVRPGCCVDACCGFCWCGRGWGGSNGGVVAAQ